jgi:hypothetical protein
MYSFSGVSAELHVRQPCSSFTAGSLFALLSHHWHANSQAMKHARWWLVLLNVVFVPLTVLARFPNMGWLTVAGVLTGIIPLLGLMHVVAMMLLAFRRPLTSFHIGLLLATNLLWVIVAIVLPDGGDTGTYAVLGLIKNPPGIINAIAWVLVLLALAGDLAAYVTVIGEALQRRRQPAS